MQMQALQSRQALIWTTIALAVGFVASVFYGIASLTRVSQLNDPLLDVEYRYFIDETNELPLDYVIEHAPFATVQNPEAIPWKLEYQTFWIQVEFDYKGLTERHLHILTDNTTIDYLDAYHLVDGDQIVTKYEGGDVTQSRLANMSLPASVPVTLLPDKANTLLIKVTSSDMPTMPLWVMSHQAYDQLAKAIHLLWGGFITFMLLVTLYSVGVYVYSRQRVYLIYVLNTLMATVLISANHGFSRYFLPDWAQVFVSNHILAFAVCLLTIALWFTYFFLDFERSRGYQRVRSMFLMATGALAGLALLTFITPPYISASLVLLSQVPIYGLVIYFLIKQWQPGKFWLLLFGLSWLPAMAGGLAFYALLLGYSEYTLMSRYALMLSMGLTMMLFSVALAERFRFQRMNAMDSLTHDKLSGLPNTNVVHIAINELIARNISFNLCCVTIDNYNNLLPYLDEDTRKSYINTIVDRILEALDVEQIYQIDTESDTPFQQLGCLKEGVFTFLIQEADLETCNHILESVIEGLNGELAIGSFITHINARIGVCHYPSDGAHPSLLINRAMQALQQHRSVLGGYTHFNNHEHKYHELHVSLVADLREAIENDGLELYHQPQIDLRTGSIHGSEVLARWMHPRFGQISPDVFVRMAEDVGIINNLTLWVIRRAFQQQQQLIASGHCRRLSINISASDIYIPNLAARVVDLASQYDVPTNLVSLELTESVMVEDYDWLKRLISELSASGIEVSIDDYGTGYSSLYFLSQLPFTELKIDRSFVRNLPQSGRHQSIVRATTDMARSLGVMVVAEGVECEEAEALLRRYGVDVGQGFYYSRPLPFNQYQAYVQRMDNVQPVTILRQGRLSSSG
ncbi:EAL domain-containing protein [Salinivibrio proteolyticus]|uniref:EAL domain-containing protein n=1 Tax=Salinivibrio proteolyticus TaxID=334715 RepID=UPI000988BA46|nr:EAL domain-containing protein [Salinivibrio proteolyticus]OOF30820.1 hypothetical protein BZJ20_08610 [Salinivibrio proteolyticus]